MRINADEFRAHFKKKAGRMKCHLCRKGPLHFTDSLFRVEECVELSGMAGTPAALVVQIICENCGGASFVNVMAADIEIITDEPPSNMTEYLR